MNTFIKLYDWTIETGLGIEERVILSLIAQFSENNSGFWAGYKAMADRTGIPKARCKQIVEQLTKTRAVIQRNAAIFGKTRAVFTLNPEYARFFIN